MQASLPGGPHAPPRTLSPQTRYAGFEQRFAAVVIDRILLTVFDFIPWLLLGFSDAPLNYLFALPALLLLRVLLSWLYEALMISSPRRATVGKITLGIEVVDLEGKRLSFARASGRHFAKYISSLVLMIGYLVQPFTPKKQALHDMLADTVVIRD